MRTFTRRSPRRLTLPLAAGVSLLLPLLLPTNGRLENAVNRALPSPLDGRLLLVGIDDASLHDYGRLDVWPRELYAAALGTLNEAGVRAVGLDVLLSAPLAGDTQVNRAFNPARLVLATAPGDVPGPPLPPGWKVTTGVSALNAPTFQGVREVQTGYPVAGTSALMPSFARQVAAQVAPPLPLSTQRRLIRYVSPRALAARTIPFRDIVNGNVRFRDLQGKVAVIGLTASGLSSLHLPDLDGTAVPGTALQVRAISSLLQAPLTRLPLALTMLACLLAAAAAFGLGSLWGFGVAAAALLLSVPLWHLNIVFPGVTVSFAALAGTALVAFEPWWYARRLGTHDPLTGFGNRLAFTRAVEQRWRGRQDRPVGLLLIDLDNLRQIQELHGRLTGEQAVKAVAECLQHRQRRGDVAFRWGTDEFAVLLDQVTLHGLAAATEHYFSALQGLSVSGTPVNVNVGGAVTGSDVSSPTELIDAASRSRYRMKFQRELQVQTPHTSPADE